MPPRDDDDDSAPVGAARRGAIAETNRKVSDLRRDVDRLEERHDEDTGRIERQLESQAVLLGDLREGHGRVAGELSHLVRAYERAATVATSQVMTDLEVKKADALAEIKDRGLDRKHRRAVRREFLFKAIAIATGGVTLLYAALQSRC